MDIAGIARSWFSIGSLLALSGCSTVPLPEDVTRKTTYDIVQQIRCEARRAVIDFGYYYKTASVAYEFEFNITEDNNASGDITSTIPFLNGGSFSLVANAGSNRIRQTKRNFKVADTFDELRQTKCSREQIEANWVYPISGDIGVYEVVRTFILLQDVTNKQSGAVFTFADTLTFTTSLNGGVQPKLILSPVTDRFRVVAANADFNAARSDVHTVTLTLAGAPPKATGAPLGKTLVPLVGFTAGNNSLVSTTIIQSAVNPKDRALIELDRQRILALQARSQNLLVGP